MHKHFLLQALALARIRRGFCAPNPSVGAIVVKNDEIIAAGYHFAAGQPHAEVIALNKLTQEQSNNATIYITLEPCCHHGKTPPCTDMLIARGIKHVYYGFADPNPLVKNKSAAQLQKANIQSEYIPLPEIAEFYRSYLYWQQTKKPFITAKLALSLDGKIALAKRKPTQISSAEANVFTHECRRMSDAILTTAMTINQDDPQLNARINGEIIAKPLYILDRELKLKPQSKIFSTSQSLTIFYDNKIAREKLPKFNTQNIRFYPIATNESGLNLAEIMQQIGHDGIHDLWIEAGGTLVENLILENQLQRLYLYISPICLGDSAFSAFTKKFSLVTEAESIGWSALGVDGLCEILF